MPTTIQTIKEAEEKIPHTKECIQANKELGEKFGMEFGKKCMCDRPKKISELHQTLLAVFESELANVPAEFSPLFPCEACETEDGENQCPNCFVMQGRNNIFAKQRSHYTEVINYLKQK